VPLGQKRRKKKEEEEEEEEEEEKIFGTHRFSNAPPLRQIFFERRTVYARRFGDDARRAKFRARSLPP